MRGKAHYRVRGVNCGKCNRIHTWYKYRVWREGKKVKEEYVGKCDRAGNTDFTKQEAHHHSENTSRQEDFFHRQQENQQKRQQRSPYVVLGISHNATTAQIKKAYHKLVKKYHPDVNKQADSRIIAEINVAYHILMKQ